MLERVIDMKTLRVREDELTPLQKRFIHLIDPRFLPYNEDLYASNDYSYEPDLDLQEEVFNLYPLFRKEVLAASSRIRFTDTVNEVYLAEKFFEDKWVSEGNNRLAQFLKHYFHNHRKRNIKLLDIGPSGGAITTLFALKTLDQQGLLDQVEIYLLDVVQSVLDITKRGEFIVPQGMIEEYKLEHAGKFGEQYKELMQSDRVHPIVYDGETFPEKVRDIDIALSAYVHHHLNIYQRRNLATETERVTNRNGFIGVVDFYVNSFKEYMQWYRTHFEKHGIIPPTEYPRISVEQTMQDYKQTRIVRIDSNLKNSFAFWGIKK